MTLHHWAELVRFIVRWSECNKVDNCYGHEFKRAGLLKRMKAFLGFRLHLSFCKKLDGTIKYSVHSTLVQWTGSLASIIIFVHGDAFSRAEGDAIRAALGKQALGSKRIHHLQNKRLRRLTFNVPEIRLLLNHSMTYPVSYETGTTCNALKQGHLSTVDRLTRVVLSPGLAMLGRTS